MKAQILALQLLFLQFVKMFPTRGTRPKSATLVRPRWLAYTPAGSGAVVPPPNNPPIQNVTSGPMTTSIQFASEEQFNGHGYNVLHQAHAASVQFAVMSTQLAATQNTMMPVIHPVFGPQSSRATPAIAGPVPGTLLAPNSFGNPAITAVTSPGALQPHWQLQLEYNREPFAFEAMQHS